MKMTKILVGAVAAVAMVAGLTSCGDWSLTSALQKTIGEDIFKYSDATYAAGLGTWTINYDNTEGEGEEGTTSYVRGGKFLLTKHSDITAVVTLKDQTTLSKDGVVGTIFNAGKTKNEDGEDVWHFMIAGVRNNKGQAAYYVSYFGNVKEADLPRSNFGAVKNEGTNKEEYVMYTSVEEANKAMEAGELTTAYEIPYTVGGMVADLGKPGEIRIEDDGTMKIVIEVKESPKTADDAGAYTINFYKGDVYNADNHTFNVTDVTPVKSAYFYRDWIGKDKAAQAMVGVYANVYADSKLSATVEILDLTNAAVVVE